MELRLPLELSPGREAACRAVFGTWGFSERCTEKLPLRVDCIHRLEFGEVSGHPTTSARTAAGHTKARSSMVARSPPIRRRYSGIHAVRSSPAPPVARITRH